MCCFLPGAQHVNMEGRLLLVCFKFLSVVVVVIPLSSHAVKEFIRQPPGLTRK